MHLHKMTHEATGGGRGGGGGGVLAVPFPQVGLNQTKKSQAADS